LTWFYDRKPKATGSVLVSGSRFPMGQKNDGRISLVNAWQNVEASWIELGRLFSSYNLGTSATEAARRLFDRVQQAWEAAELRSHGARAGGFVTPPRQSQRSRSRTPPNTIPLTRLTSEQTMLFGDRCKLCNLKVPIVSAITEHVDSHNNAVVFCVSAARNFNTHLQCAALGTIGSGVPLLWR